MVKRLIEVDSGAFDDLMYWLDRCESKGHLENCYDLVEPWKNFSWKEVSEDKFESVDVVAVKRDDLLAMSGDVDSSTGRSEMECYLYKWLKGNEIPVIRYTLFKKTEV